MLTLSILWIVLAASVCMIAILRRSPGDPVQDAGPQTRESGGALTVLAVVYGVVLLAGFLYVSRFLVSSL